jgi:hypothetical protein
MALDPRIPLGIQPIQQPNMLGQYAQVMGIKAAQQEMEGNESTRNYFSRPVSERGDPSQLLGTKQGQAAYKALNEGQVKQLEAEQKRINLIGAGAGAVLENPTMETFTSVVSNLVDRGIYTPQQRDQAFAAIGNDPSKIKAFVTPIYNQAISAEKRLSDITSRRGQDITAGTTMRGQDISARTAAERLAFDQNKPIGTVTGEDGYLYNKMSDGSIRLAKIGGMPVPATGTTAPAGGGSEAGGTVTGTAGSGGVNALAPAPVNSLVSPTASQPFKPQGTQFAPQLADIQNPLNPSQTIKGVYDPATKSYIPIEVQRPGMTVGGGESDSFNVAVPSSTAVGYRRTADGKGLEFIPGGPADPEVQAKQSSVKLSTKDIQAREAKYPQATSALKAFNAKTNKFERDIDELIANEKGLNEITGFLAGRTDLSAMSQEGRRALALFNTITAKGGFSELQDMRNSSPTGGALGNVSNQEGKQLIDSFGALSRTQSGDDLRKSLETAKSDLQNLKQRMGEAYELTYEYKRSGNVPAVPPGFTLD